jgi:hypothetical protein
MLTACSCGLIISAILLLSKVMANPDEVFGDYVACPDDTFEAMLTAQETRKNDLYEIYTSGCRYASACLDALLDSIRLLYGEEVCAQTRFCLHNYLQDESTLQVLGASWHLCSTAELERSRVDYLGAFNIDLRDFLEYVPIDCSELLRFWDSNADDVENLELISVHIEAVHGLAYERDFRALLLEVESEHETLLNVVVCILKQHYGDYGLWRQEVRRRAAMRPQIDWNEALAS